MADVLFGDLNTEAGPFGRVLRHLAVTFCLQHGIGIVEQRDDEGVVCGGEELGLVFPDDPLQPVAERAAALVITLQVSLLGELLEGDEMVGLRTRAPGLRDIEIAFFHLAGLRVDDHAGGQGEGAADLRFCLMDRADAVFEEGALAGLDLPEHRDRQMGITADMHRAILPEEGVGRDLQMLRQLHDVVGTEHHLVMVTAFPGALALEADLRFLGKELELAAGVIIGDLLLEFSDIGHQLGIKKKRCLPAHRKAERKREERRAS